MPTFPPLDIPKISFKAAPPIAPTTSMPNIDTMDFFSKEKLDVFRNDTKIKKFLDEKMEGGVLLNKEEMRDYIALTRLNQKKRNIYYLYSDLQKVVFRMVKEVCRGKIGTEYGKHTANDALIHEPDLRTFFRSKFVKVKFSDKETENARYDHKNYDILLLMTKDYAKLKYYTIDEKLSNVLGFIIVQKGECELHPEALAIKLICTRTSVPTEDEPILYKWVKSSILLGAYLCMIKSSKYEQLGLLELADGYNNLPGLCAYIKFGFREDSSLVKDGCFPNVENVAMSVRLDSHDDSPDITFESIINVIITGISNNGKPYEVESPYELCTTLTPSSVTQKDLQEKLQKKIAENYQEIHQSKHQPNPDFFDQNLYKIELHEILKQNREKFNTTKTISVGKAKSLKQNKNITRRATIKKQKKQKKVTTYYNRRK